MVSIFMVLSLVFVSPNTQSDYKVFVTNRRSEADLIVFRTNSRYEAKDTEWIWSETNTKYQSHFSIRYVTSKYQSDLIIFFTKNKYEAGWKKSHPLKESLKKVK